MLLRRVTLFQMPRVTVAAAGLGLVLLLSACSQSDATPRPTRTPRPTPIVFPTLTPTPVPTARPTSTPTIARPTPTIARPEGEHVLFLNGDPVTTRSIAFTETQVTASTIPTSPSLSYPSGTVVTLAYQTTLEGIRWGGDAAQCAEQTSCTLTLDSDMRVELGSDGLPVFLSALALRGIQVRSRVPSQVQFTFSLRDQDDRAVVLPGAAIQARTHIFERPEGATLWEEIDYAETSFFVHTAENLALDIVFVLDFSNSVAQTVLSDGRSGTDAIRDAFEAAIRDLPNAHRIGVVEFHDRSFVPSVLARLTSDRETVLGDVRAFTASAYDPGSSRVWDALEVAMDLLPDVNRTIRSIVFLSDGRDTSSTTSAAAIVSRAVSDNISLYPVGVGDAGDAATLISMAGETGGTYYQAPGFEEIGRLLERIINDLRGQYTVSYNTLRTDGLHESRVDVSIGAATGTFVSQPIDFAEIFGADNVGQLITDPPAYDVANARTVIFVRALHVPRNVTHLRLRLVTDRALAAELVEAEDGGLLSGWTLEGPDEHGWVIARSASPMAFGNFGLLLRLTVEGIEIGEILALEIDNSGYDGQKSFNDTTEPGVAGSCAALADILSGFPVERSLRFQADSAVHIGIDSICAGLLEPILMGGISTPTPTPSPTPVPENQWVEIGTLLLARSHAATALLQDGTALVIGGRFANQEALASVDRYSPDTGVWAPAPPLKTPRESATATTLLDGRVLVVGGRPNAEGEGLRNSEVYEPVVDLWIDLTASSGSAGTTVQPRLGHTATLLEDGRVLIVGGMLGSGAELTAEVFDPDFSTFSAVEDVDFARENHAAVLMNDGSVWLFGSKAPDIRVIERFDPVTNAFSPVGVLRESYLQLTATLLADGSVLILGMSPTTAVQAEIVSPDGVSRTVAAAGVLKDTRAVFRTPSGGFLFVGSKAALGPNVLPDASSINATEVDDSPIEVDGATWTRLESGEVILVGGLDSPTVWRFVY